MDVSSVHWPGWRRHGPPPTMSEMGSKVPGRLNSNAAPNASPTARPSSAPRARSRRPAGCLSVVDPTNLLPSTDLLPSSSAPSTALRIQQLHVRKGAFGAAKLFQTQLQADSEGKRERSQGNEQPDGESPAQVGSDQVVKGAPKDGKDQRRLHQGVQP